MCDLGEGNHCTSDPDYDCYMGGRPPCCNSYDGANCPKTKPPCNVPSSQVVTSTPSYSVTSTPTYPSVTSTPTYQSVTSTPSSQSVTDYCTDASEDTSCYRSGLPLCCDESNDLQVMLFLLFPFFLSVGINDHSFAISSNSVLLSSPGVINLVQVKTTVLRKQTLAATTAGCQHVVILKTESIVPRADLIVRSLLKFQMSLLRATISEDTNAQSYPSLNNCPANNEAVFNCVSCVIYQCVERR